MAAMVEATSLQAVTDLAANPPAHPHAPLHAASPPLTLYIARVPGSRDVFLTPIKPREKVVTAEDVQSSLYYVHVSCTEDYAPLPQPSLLPSSVNTDSRQLSPISERPRKAPPPLPKRPSAAPPLPSRQPLPYPVNDPLPPVPARPPTPPKQPHQISRKPLLSDIAKTPPVHAETRVDLPSLPPRPLPTPPDEPPFEESSLHADNLRLLRRSSHLDDYENPYARDYNSHPETLKQLELDSRPELGSLTLIRRDPGSSQQWNVASVYDPPVLEVSSSTLFVPTAKRRTKKGGTPLYLDITNSGYAKFTLQSSPDLTRISTSSDTSSDLPPEGTFRRRLYMPGSRYGTNAYGTDSRRKNVSVSAASGETSIRQSMRDERHSVDLGAVGDKRTKGYTFASPWDGMCEFITGPTGRSLKCRHRLGNSAAEVSELRFNLPSSSKPTKSNHLASKSSSYFQRHRHLQSSDSIDDFDASPTIMVTEDGRIDLSLGQERAGGGFGGKQAKLGKLIIEPEGIKMLDLLVAANVGLWWRAWERIE